MALSTLRAFKVINADFVNSVNKNKKIELGFSYSYNVKYSESNACVGEFLARIADKEDEKEFHLNVTATGLFGFTENAKKELLHVETYNALFPYVRAFVTTFTSNAGIPPIIIPFIDISNKEIYRFELGKNGEHLSPDDFVNPYDDNQK